MPLLLPRSRSALLALLISALVACDAARPPDADDDAPELVLLYLVDTLRADHLGSYGYARETSPNLDAFAADAVLFERAHAQAPWTKASVASLLTGLQPAYTDATEKHQRLPRRLDTLAEVFSHAGFHTAAFVANPWVTAAFGFEQGFDTFRDVTREDSVLLSNAEDMNRALLPYLEQLPRDRPHFIYVHARDPHDPYSPPAPYDSLFGAEYQGALQPEHFDWRLDVEPADLERLVAL